MGTLGHGDNFYEPALGAVNDDVRANWPEQHGVLGKICVWVPRVLP